MIVPDSECLHCSKIINGAIQVNGDQMPSPGDYSICVYCGHLMVFGDNLILRNPLPIELNAIAGERVLLKAQEIAAAFREGKNEDR